MIIISSFSFFKGGIYLSQKFQLLEKVVPKYYTVMDHQICNFKLKHYLIDLISQSIDYTSLCTDLKSVNEVATQLVNQLVTSSIELFKKENSVHEIIHTSQIKSLNEIIRVKGTAIAKSFKADRLEFAK